MVVSLPKIYIILDETKFRVPQHFVSQKKIVADLENPWQLQLHKSSGFQKFLSEFSHNFASSI